MAKVKEEGTKELELLNNNPIDDPKRYEEYVNILHTKVMSEDVYNIGIIGSFSSGKSSLIKTYKNKYWKKKKKRFSTITLANFDSPLTKKTEGEDKEEKSKERLDEELCPVSDVDSKLEKSILEQLLFKVNKDKVPSSRISRIRATFFPSLFLALSLLATIVLTFLAAFVYCQKDSVFNFCEHAFEIYLVADIVFLGGFLFLVLYNSKINKISVSKIEVELNKDSNESVLNLFIDEIIYFFRMTKTAVVVFEDIERFHNIAIFSKLRELNTLINNNESVGQKVTFIYAINESIIKSQQDRAKFFDFILTFRPLVDALNSSDYISSKLDNQISKNTIEDFSVFLHDARIINNVVNDYKLMKMQLDRIIKEKYNNIHLDNDKIFAQAAYKNICPSDYSEFIFNKGKLRKILVDEKKEVIKRIIEALNIEIKTLEEELDDLNKAKLVPFEYVRLLIIGYLDKHGSFSNDQNIEQQYSPIDTIKTLDDTQKGYYIRLPDTRDIYSRPIRSYKFSSKENLLEYFKKDDIVKVNLYFNDINKIIKEKNKKKNDLEKEVFNIQQMDISKLLQKHPQYFSFGATPEEAFMKFSLKKGYIDDTFPLYFMRENNQSLSLQDSSFINAVIAYEETDQKCQFDNIYVVAKRIPEDRYLTPYVLNFDLVDFVFNNSNLFEKECQNIITFLCQNKKERENFLQNYFAEGHRELGFVIALFKSKEEILNEFLCNAKMAKENKVFILNSLFDYYFQNDFSIGKLNEAIRDYFSKDPDSVADVLFVSNNNASTRSGIVNFLLENNIHVNNLNKLKGLDDSLIDSICEKHCFSQNYENIRFLIDRYYSEFAQVSISNIKKIKNSSVLNSFKNNQNIMETIISGTTESIEENEDVMREIFNDKTVEEETKNKYAAIISNKIDFNDSLSKDYLKFLVSTNKVQLSWPDITTILKKYPDLRLDIEKYLLFEDNERLFNSDLQITDLSPFKDNAEILIRAIQKNEELAKKLDTIKLQQPVIEKIINSINLDDNIIAHIIISFENTIPSFGNETLAVITKVLSRVHVPIGNNSVDYIYSKKNDNYVSFGDLYFKQLNKELFVDFCEQKLGMDAAFLKHDTIGKMSKEKYLENQAIYDEINSRGIVGIKIQKKFCYFLR